MNFPDDTVEPKPQLLPPDDAAELKPSTKPRALMGDLRLSKLPTKPPTRWDFLPPKNGILSSRLITGYPYFLTPRVLAHNGIPAPRIWRLSAFLYIVDTYSSINYAYASSTASSGGRKMKSFNGGK